MNPYLDGGFLLALLAKLPGSPVASQMLHPAMVLASGATHFFSFDPRSRLLARSHGIKLAPDKL